MSEWVLILELPSPTTTLSLKDTPHHPNSMFCGEFSHLNFFLSKSTSKFIPSFKSKYVFSKICSFLHGGTEPYEAKSVIFLLEER